MRGATASVPAAWPEVAIGEIADVVGGGTPSTKDPANFDGDIPWLTPKDLSGPHDRYIGRGERNLSQQGIGGSSAKLLPTGSVLLSTRAPIGYVALAKNPIATNQGFRSLVVRDGALPEYLYYWLRLNTEELERHASGSTFRELSGSSLKDIRLRLPPLDEQRAIARVLGALDDKIELNRRMSATLEAMARALFKSWFVDFEPVRAKAAGRPSGLPPALDALFPASFEASELGEIPSGWGVGTLGQFFELAVGGVWGKDGADQRATEPRPCLRGIDCHALAEGQVPEARTRWFTPRQLTKREIPAGTILLEGSGSFCGRSLLWRDDLGNLFDHTPVYSNFVKRLDRTSCRVSQAAVCWQFIRNAFREGEIQMYRTGTAFPNLDVKGLLANLMVVVPPEPVADRYAELGGWGPSAGHMAQSQSLAEQRDALLPRLVSGEVRVGGSQSLGALTE